MQLNVYHKKKPKKPKADPSRELLIFNGKVADKVIKFLIKIGIPMKFIHTSKKKGI